MNVSETNAKENLSIAVIDASNKALPSLQKVFSRLSSPFSIAIVLVLEEKNPTTKIESFCDRKITAAKPGLKIEKNHIYLCCSNDTWIIKNRYFQKHNDQSFEPRLNRADHTMSSLAEDIDTFSIGIKLGGSKLKSSYGLQSIKQAGGLTICEEKVDCDPDFEMITQVAEWSLTSEKIFPHIETYLAQIDSHELSQGNVIQNNIFQKIFSMLADVEGIEFNKYRPTTVLRRIEKRMALHKIIAIKDYFHLLKSDADEVHELHASLLIGVTQFFRDANHYEKMINTALVDLINKATAEPIRIWVAGCSTGEEAYSMAMAVEKKMGELNRRVDYKIFATDMDKEALKVASTGCYSQAAIKQLPENYLDHFFIKRGKRYEINRSIRSHIMFSTHNLIRDAPFSRVDFVSCRNVLIYFEPMIQNRVLANLHFSLKKGGYLFLGPCESISGFAVDVEVIDTVAKVFRKKNESIYLSGHEATTSLLNTWGNANPPELIQTEHQSGDHLDFAIHWVSNKLCNEYIPASILINENLKIIKTYNPITRFLSKYNLDDEYTISEQDGEVHQEIQKLIKSDKLKSYEKAVSKVSIKEEEETIDFYIIVCIVGNRNLFKDSYFLISFTPGNKRIGSKETPKSQTDLEKEVAILSNQLMNANFSLRSAMEEIKYANVELQSKNEELSSSNEELQSTNEELKTLNEQLMAMKLNYQKQIDSAHDDLKELSHTLKVASIAILILDEDLNIAFFTKAVKDFIPLAEHDIGRPVDIFSCRIDNLDLMAMSLEARAKNRNITLLRTLNDQEITVKISSTGSLFNKSSNQSKPGFVIKFS